MKTASTALINLLTGGSFVSGVTNPGAPFAPFDLYTITLMSGEVLTYTSADFMIAAPNNTIFTAPRVYGSGSDTWFSGMSWAPMVIDSSARQTGHWKIGLDSDKWQFSLSPRPFDVATKAPWPDTINGQPWLAAVRAGALDNADVIVSRAYFASLPTWPMPAGGAVPVGTLIIFRGVVGEIDLSNSGANLTVNDYKSVLTQLMPRNLYQAGCRHQLFDGACTLSAASYATSGVLLSGTTNGVLKATPSAPSGSGTWSLGRVLMTSGENAGISRLVMKWDGSQTFNLLKPFPLAINPGETFTIWPGCDKQLSTCTTWGNAANFGGEPYIPAPEVNI